MKNLAVVRFGKMLLVGGVFIRPADGFREGNAGRCNRPVL
jgi:hypothetical protein